MLRSLAVSGALFASGAFAAEVTVFQSASGDSGACVDHADFVAENAEKCSWFTGKDCPSLSGFSQFGKEMLMCNCPVACGNTDGCRSSVCIKDCKVDTAYTTYTSAAGYTEVTKADLVNGCTAKLANYKPCNHGYQCSSGFCCPNMSVCLTDANTAITKNDVEHPFIKALFDKQAANVCQVTSTFAFAGGPQTPTSEYQADWSTCEESGGLPYAAGAAGNGVDGGFDKTKRACACAMPYLLEYYDNRWVDCSADSSYTSKCTRFSGTTPAGGASTATAATTAAPTTSYNIMAVTVDIPAGGTVAELDADVAFKANIALSLTNYLTTTGVTGHTVAVTKIAAAARRRLQTASYVATALKIDYTVTAAAAADVANIDTKLADSQFGTYMTGGVDQAIGASVSVAGSAWKAWMDSGLLPAEAGTVTGASNEKTTAPAPAAAPAPSPSPDSSASMLKANLGLAAFSAVAAFLF